MFPYYRDQMEHNKNEIFSEQKKKVIVVFIFVTLFYE